MESGAASPRRRFGPGLPHVRVCASTPPHVSSTMRGMFGLDTVVVLLIVLAVVLVWRGPKTLPKWGEALGRGVRAARREAGGLRRHDDGEDGTAGTPKP